MMNPDTQRLYALLEQARWDEACQYTDTHIQQNQTIEPFVLFYILLHIRQEEKAEGVVDIFSNNFSTQPSAMLSHYTQIKLYLRRFEYAFPQSALEEAYAYFQQTHTSLIALYRIIQFANVDKNTTWKRLMAFYESQANPVSSHDTVN